jgi:hypothetical protein
VASTPRTARVDDDFHGWLVQQAQLLHDRETNLVDWDAIAEELEEMGRRERDALVSNLEIVLSHMLKLAYEVRSTERTRNERQWKLDITEHRNRIQDILERSGSLSVRMDQFVAKAYGRARKMAGIAIAKSQQPIGPLQCPWPQPQILDDDFFPHLTSRQSR